jgi:hypothetical protein
VPDGFQGSGRAGREPVLAFKTGVSIVLFLIKPLAGG